MNSAEIRKMAKLHNKRSDKAKKVAVLLSAALVMVCVFLYTVVMFFGYLYLSVAADPVNKIVKTEFDGSYAEAIRQSEFAEKAGEALRFSSTVFSFTAPLVEAAACEEKVYLDGAELSSSKEIKPDSVRQSVRGSGQIRYVRPQNDRNRDLAVADSYATAVQIVDTSAHSNAYALPSLVKKYGLKEGDGFYGDAKGQILVSERFCEFFKTSGVAGKKLTYRLDYGDYVFNSLYALDDNTDSSDAFNEEYKAEPAEITVFENFEIVGVFDNGLLGMNYDCDFIVSSNSLRTSDFPVITSTDIIGGTRRVLTYSDTDLKGLSEKVAGEGYMFPVMLYNGFFSPWECFNADDYRQGAMLDSPVKLVQYEFGSVGAVINYIDATQDLFGENAFLYMACDNVYPVDTLTVRNTLDDCTAIFVILGIYGFMLLIVTLLGYINSLSYLVLLRKPVLGMYRTIGFGAQALEKLFRAEVTDICRKAMTVTAAVLTVAAGLFVFLSSGYQSVSVGLTFAAAAIAYALVMCFPAILTLLLGKSLGKLMLKYAE